MTPTRPVDEVVDLRKTHGIDPEEVRQILKEPGAVPDVDPFNPLKNKPLPPHVQRMALETQQVVTNLRKMSAFIHDDAGIFKTLPVIEQRLMVEQHGQMWEYARTLSLRYCMALLDHG